MVIYNTAFLLSSCRWSPVEPVETAPVDVRRSPPPVESAGGAGGIFSGTGKGHMKFSGTHRKCIEYLTALVPLIAEN